MSNVTKLEQHMFYVCNSMHGGDRTSWYHQLYCIQWAWEDLMAKC